PSATAAADGGCGSSILPNSSIRAAPQSGNSGISQMRSKKFILYLGRRSRLPQQNTFAHAGIPAQTSVGLPFQQVHFVGQHGLFISEQRDQDAQADRRLRYRVGNDEDREDLAAHVLP